MNAGEAFLASAGVPAKAAATPGFETTFKWFFAGTLGEIFGIMWVLVAYLFPRNRPNPYGDH